MVPEDVSTSDLLDITIGHDEWWKLLVVWGPGHELLPDETINSEYLPAHDIDGARKVSWKFGGRITYSKALNGWRVWNGRAHVPDDCSWVEAICNAFADAHSRAVIEVDAAFRVRAEAEFHKAVGAGVPKDEARRQLATRQKEWRGWMKDVNAYQRRLRSDAGQKALVSRLQTDCAVVEEQFDADGRWLVVGNGVLDLGMVQRTGALDGRSYGPGEGAGWTGEGAGAVRGAISGGVGPGLLAHSYRRLVTQGTGVQWRGWEAECAWFDWYLARSIPSDSLRRYIQKWCGAFLLGGLGGGGVKEKALINLIGEPDSGKTLLLNVMKAVWEDYVGSVPVEVFLTAGHGGGKGEAGYGKHELRGKRLVISSEPGAGRSMDDSLVKELAGGELISSREVYGRYVQWRARCTIVISSNHPMRINTADTAMMRRLRPIAFDISFSDAPGVPEDRQLKRDLEDVIKLELPGVMRWCLDGLLMYLAEGIGEPEEVTAKREALAEEMDSSLMWARHALDVGEVRPVDADGTVLDGSGVRVPVVRGDLLNVSKAYEVYRVWASEVEDIKIGKEQSKKVFSQVLARVYGKPVKVRGYMRFPGLTMGGAWPSWAMEE